MSTEFIQNKRIFIVGGTGSLGNQLTKTWIKNNEIYVYSRNEMKQWKMKKEFPKAHYFIGNIQHSQEMSNAMLEIKPNIIIIACALKHVDVCEKFTGTSIRTNVNGVENILELLYTWYKQGSNLTWLESVLFTSTDKACEPITVYGMCKAISERNMVNMAEKFKGSGIRFLSVRYGNVFSSNGSLLHVFQNIANDENRKEFTVTHPDMTRFFMTLEQSVELIEDTLRYGLNGEIWIPKLKSFKVMDLAEYFSKKHNKPISFIGLRGIEKIHEKLIGFYEENTVFDIKDRYVISPTLSKRTPPPKKVVENYSSDTTLQKWDFEQCINLV